ncbi:hypothetical protein LINPERHAP2_LOCUS29722 [Linum perenne]
MSFITNSFSKKICARKRREILKMIEELTILCGVEGFCIVYSPDELEVAVWPPEELETHRVMVRYMAMPH